MQPSMGKCILREFCFQIASQCFVSCWNGLVTRSLETSARSNGFVTHSLETSTRWNDLVTCLLETSTHSNNLITRSLKTSRRLHDSVSHSMKTTGCIIASLRKTWTIIFLSNDMDQMSNAIVQHQFNWCWPFLGHKGLVYLPCWVITKNTWLNHGIHHFSLEIKKKCNNEVNLKSIVKYVAFFFLKYTHVLQISNWRELGSPVLKRPAGVVPLMTDHYCLVCQTLTRKYPNSRAP